MSLKDVFLRNKDNIENLNKEIIDAMTNDGLSSSDEIRSMIITEMYVKNVTASQAIEILFESGGINVYVQMSTYNH